MRHLHLPQTATASWTILVLLHLHPMLHPHLPKTATASWTVWVWVCVWVLSETTVSECVRGAFRAWWA
jgi:hypothetical protein